MQSFKTALEFVLEGLIIVITLMLAWRMVKGFHFRANNEPTEANLEKNGRSFTVDIILGFVLILVVFISKFFF